MPEETKRIFSSDGIMNWTISPSSISRSVGAPKVVPDAVVCTMAAMTSGSAWPSTSGPQDPTKSTYRFPSTSKT